MKILVYPHNWFHQHEGGAGVAGGERYLERLLDHLSDSHEIKIVCACKEKYIHNGIECYPIGEAIELFTKHNDLAQWCDIIITQLIGSAAGYNKAIQHKKPLIFIAHNNSKQYAVIHSPQEQCNVIYNSYQLRDDLQKAFGHFNGTVLHPLLPTVTARSTGQYITLINCNHNKGGHIFAEIASRLPQYQFLGVFGGYGEQIEAHLPNVTYLPNGVDMERVYADTRILLVPSEFESFSQCSIEAMSYGIPVIAHPCPGVKENLSNAGIFIDRSDIDRYCQTISYIMENPQGWKRQSEICLERVACVMDKSRLELDGFDKWLNKISYDG